MGSMSFTVTSGETQPIAIPLTLNDQPMDLSGVTSVVVIAAGFGGKLTGAAAGSAAVLTATSGYVQWTMPSGGSALSPLLSPYHLRVRCTTSSGTVFEVPSTPNRPTDAFVLTVLEKLD